MPAVGVIKVISLNSRTPVLQNRAQLTRLYEGACEIFRHEGQPVSVDGGMQHHNDGVAGQLAADPDIELAPVFLELPGIETAGGGEA